MRFVVVNTYSRAIEAQLVTPRLEAQGIAWRLEDGALTIRNEAASRVFRRVKLMVSSSDYERVRELLGLACAKVEGARARVCPECGYRAGFFRAWFVKRGRCGACGYWWR